MIEHKTLYNCGIYKIVNKINGNYYIGSSQNLYGRWRNHLHNAKNGSKKSPHLYSAMRKYGIDNFEFFPIIFCEIDELEHYEQKLLNIHYGLSECYNTSPDSKAPWRGRKMTVMEKKRLSEALKGRPAWNKGRPRTDKERRTISEKTKQAMELRDNTPSEEHRLNLSKALKGRKFSDETRLKMSLAKKGKTPWNKGIPGSTRRKS